MLEHKILRSASTTKLDVLANHTPAMSIGLSHIGKQQIDLEYVKDVLLEHKALEVLNLHWIGVNLRAVYQGDNPYPLQLA